MEFIQRGNWQLNRLIHYRGPAYIRSIRLGSAEGNGTERFRLTGRRSGVSRQSAEQHPSGGWLLPRQFPAASPRHLMQGLWRVDRQLQSHETTQETARFL